MLFNAVIVYLFCTVGIGLLASRLVSNSRDYVNAGRRLPLVISSAALFALWFGSETLFGATSAFLEGGVLGIIEDPLGGVLCLMLFGAVFARRLYRMNLLTLGDLFRKVYGPRIELLASCFMLITFFGYIAAQLVALGLLLQLLAGMSLGQGIVVSAIVVGIYTMAGGMWAISITDFIQGIIIVAGLIWVAYLLMNRAGGWEAVIAGAPEGHFNILPEAKPLPWLHYLAAWMTLGLGSLPSQDIFQRMNAAKNERVAVRSFYLGGFLYLLIAVVPIFMVLAARQLYPHLLAGDMQQFLARVVQESMPLGVQVIFFGALLSAIFSTCSGAILAPASILAENVVRPLLRTPLSDNYFLWLLRIAVVLLTALACVMALVRHNIFALVAESSLLGLVTLLVPMYWAVFHPQKASSRGAALAMCLGFFAWWLSEYALHTAIPPLLIGFSISMAGMWLGNLRAPDVR
ncbi:MAG: sodium:solute symporter family protein [Bacteroidia bacterium]